MFSRRHIIASLAITVLLVAACTASTSPNHRANASSHRASSSKPGASASSDVANAGTSGARVLAASPKGNPSDPQPTQPAQPAQQADAGSGQGVFLVAPTALANEKAAYLGNDAAVVAAISPLIARANRDLSVTPVSVTAKTQTPPSGSKHDYMSLSVYAWPQPGAPTAPYVIRDGQKNPDIATIPDKQDLVDVINWTQELGYAYYFTGKQSYASKATAILTTWFLDPGTKMNPSLTYAQAVPNVSSGQAGGIIDTADLPQVVDAAGLLAGSQSWTAADSSGLQSWFASYLSWLRTSTQGIQEAATTNNHATWYDAQVISYALYTGNLVLAAQISELAKTNIIGNQIRGDGSQPIELARADTWSYSTYNIAALTRLAQLAVAAGVDLWNYTAPNGASIRMALDFVANYIGRLSAWPYPQSRTADLSYLTLPLFAAAAAYQDTHYRDLGQSAAASQQALYPAAAVLFPPNP